MPNEQIKENPDFKKEFFDLEKEVQKSIAQEVTETVEKLPTLEKENFKVENTEDRKEEILSMKIGSRVRDVIVKVHPQGDVREYVGFKTKENSKEEFPYEGEQIFTYEAAQRELFMADKYDSWIANASVVEKLIAASAGETPEEKYQSFIRENNIVFSGIKNPFKKYDPIGGVGESGFLRFSDGKAMSFWENKYATNSLDKNFAFSVRCIAQ